MKNDFNRALRDIRKKKGLTQDQLADAVGVSAQAFSKWELNGYPDSSLLPVIADYLGVSIDELFGNPKEEADILDKVVWYIKEQPFDEQIQKAMDMARAVSLGLMFAENFYNITENQFNSPDLELFSECTRKNGFVQSRLCENLQYFLIMPEPKKGYDDILKYDESYVKLFKLLSKPDALRAMYYFAGRNGRTFLTVDSLAKALGIAPDKAQEILDEMAELKLLNCSSLSSKRGDEKIYKSSFGCNFVSFIAFCRTLLNKPTSFNNQSEDRDGESYFKNDTQIIKSEKDK